MPDATALTDYLLAAVTAALGLLLVGGAKGSSPVRLWGLAFVALAAASLLGGVWHHFEHDFDAVALVWIWRANEWAIGLFGLGAVAATAMAAVAGRPRAAILALAALVFAAFGVWTFDHPQFRYVAAYDAVVMATVLALQLTRLRQSRATPWIVAGIAVSLLAAAVQASDLAVFGLDHNALFHLVQLAAMLLLFAGARLLRARPSTFPPALPK